MGELIKNRRALLKSEQTVTPPVGDSYYGVDWFYSNSSPLLTRIGAAELFADPQPATSLSGTGSSPFDSIMPWAGMKRYNIINGAVSYSEDDAGFDPVAYDTMVYIPEFYYRAEKDTTEQRWTWAISPTAQDGFSKHPGSGRYIGRYHSSGSSSGVFSQSGVTPLVRTSRSNFRTYSHNKGANWWMLDIATWSALQLLYLVEFADFDSQSALGTGYAGVTSAVAAVGDTDAAAYHTLKISSGHNQYRWVEDPFSNCFDYVDGFLAHAGASYIGTDNSNFADSTTDLIPTGITLPYGEYITGFGYSETCPWAFIPDSASGGSAVTFVTDYVASATAYDDTRVYAVGGYYSSNNGERYGLFYFNAVYQYNYAIVSYLGSRLIFIP